MTIMNEAVRLFFAVSALILVAMLSTPMGGLSSSVGDTRAALEDPMREIASISQTSSQKTQLKTQKGKNTANKVTAKKIAKLTKPSRKVARRG